MNICIFGDSITWGAFDYEKGGWVERLKSSLMEDASIISNLGIYGDTTEGLLERFETEAGTRGPDALIFAIGINDALMIENIDPDRLEEFDNNISSLCSLAKEMTDKIIFIGLTRIEEENGTHQNDVIKEYDSIIEASCKDNGITYIKMFDLLQNDDLEDGLHPNSEGHRKMFEKIMETIKSAWLS